MIPQFLSEPLVYAIGWTLVHSLWQGALVALPLALLLAVARSFTPRTRYVLSATGLLLIAGMAVATFTGLYRSAPDAAAPSGGIYLQAAALPETRTAVDVPLSAPDPTTTISTLLEANLPLVVVVWMAGILFFAAKFLAELLYIRRVRRGPTALPSPYWQGRFGELCRRTKVQGVRLAESALVQVPVVIGFFKPVVLLPLGTLLGLPAAQVEAVLAHELAHIRRYDYLVNILQTIAEIIFFYHPAVWWLSSRMRVEREHCCDDIAIAVSGSSAALAEALVELQERVAVPRPALAATGGKYHLLDRIRRIAEQPNKRSTPAERGVAVCVLAAALLIMSFSARALFSQQTETPVDDSTTAPERVMPDQPAAPDPVSPVEQPDADGAPTQPEIPLPDSHAVRESTTNTATTVVVDNDNNGKRQRMEAQLDAQGKITELRVNGKKIPPEEFAKYQPQIDDAMRAQQEALREQEKALQAHEEAMRVHEKAMRAHEEAVRAQEKIMEQQEKIMEEQAAALERQSEILEQQARELERQSRVMENKARAMEKKMNSSQHRDANRELKRELQKLERELQKLERELPEKEREAKQQKQKSSNRQSQSGTELLRVRIAGDKEHFDLRLTDTELYLNGEKQSDTAFENFKKLLYPSGTLPTQDFSYDVIRLTDRGLYIDGEKQSQTAFENFKKLCDPDTEHFNFQISGKK